MFALHLKYSCARACLFHIVRAVLGCVVHIVRAVLGCVVHIVRAMLGCVIHIVRAVLGCTLGMQSRFGSCSALGWSMRTGQHLPSGPSWKSCKVLVVLWSIDAAIIVCFFTCKT